MYNKVTALKPCFRIKSHHVKHMIGIAFRGITTLCDPCIWSYVYKIISYIKCTTKAIHNSEKLHLYREQMMEYDLQKYIDVFNKNDGYQPHRRNPIFPQQKYIFLCWSKATVLYLWLWSKYIFIWCLQTHLPLTYNFRLKTKPIR